MKEIGKNVCTIIRIWKICFLYPHAKTLAKTTKIMLNDDDDDLELGTSIAYRASSASYPAAYLTISQ